MWNDEGLNLVWAKITLRPENRLNLGAALKELTVAITETDGEFSLVKR